MKQSSAVLLALILSLCVFSELSYCTSQVTTVTGVGDLEFIFSVLKLEYELGEVVEATLSLKNTGIKQILLEYFPNQMFDLICYDSNGSRIYGWQDAHYYNQLNLPEVMDVLDPGENYSEILVWPEMSFNSSTGTYAPLNSDSYKMEGHLFVTPEGAEPVVIKTDLIEITILDTTVEEKTWLSTSITSDREEYSVGEPVLITFNLMNYSPRIETMYINNSDLMKFHVSNSKGKLIFNDALHRSSTDEVTSVIIDSQETITYETRWEGRMDDGKYVEAGHYTIKGVFAGLPCEQVAEVRILESSIYNYNAILWGVAVSCAILLTMLIMRKFPART